MACQSPGARWRGRSSVLNSTHTPARPRALQVRQFAEKPTSASVRSGAETLQTKLANDSRDTRVAFSEAAKNHAKHFAKLSPTVDHKRAIAAKNWHAVAAGTHGWSEREAGRKSI
jgi:hypothetical protein